MSVDPQLGHFMMRAAGADQFKRTGSDGQRAKGGSEGAERSVVECVAPLQVDAGWKKEQCNGEFVCGRVDSDGAAGRGVALLLRGRENFSFPRAASCSAVGGSGRSRGAARGCGKERGR